VDETAFSVVVAGGGSAARVGRGGGAARGVIGRGCALAGELVRDGVLLAGAFLGVGLESDAGGRGRGGLRGGGLEAADEGGIAVGTVFVSDRGAGFAVLFREMDVGHFARAGAIGEPEPEGGVERGLDVEFGVAGGEDEVLTLGIGGVGNSDGGPDVSLLRNEMRLILRGWRVVEVLFTPTRSHEHGAGAFRAAWGGRFYPISGAAAPAARNNRHTSNDLC